jgi:DUF1365 family protein
LTAAPKRSVSALTSAAADSAVLLRYPLMTLQVIAAIHWQALRHWLKRVPVHTHPAKLPARQQHVPDASLLAVPEKPV